LAKLKKRGGKANVNANPSPSKPPIAYPSPGPERRAPICCARDKRNKQHSARCVASIAGVYSNQRSKPRASDNEAPAFRLKCLDCPGKLYTPGPDQTLSNFEVHLKNRGHRSNVNKRVIAEATAAGLPIPDLRRITPQTTPVPGPPQALAQVSEPAQSN
ncbi:hypothetical protein RSAG8_04220, partial [Rhizoctonia solani AG-8 WAC10335]